MTGERMRFVALALLALMMVSSCMAVNRKTLMNGMQERLLVDPNLDGNKSLTNHHNIPRQDYNNYGSSGSKGGSDGDGGNGRK